MGNKSKKPADIESRPRNKKSPNYRNAVLLLCAVILSVFVYFGLLALSAEIGVYLPVMEVFTVLIAAAVCAIFIVNAGLGDAPPFPDELPSKWDGDRKSRFIGSFAKRKAAVKKLSFLLVSLIVPVLADVIMLLLEKLGIGGAI